MAKGDVHVMPARVPTPRAGARRRTRRVQRPWRTALAAALRPRAPREHHDPVTYVVFDVLRVDGHDLTATPWSARRAVLEEVGVNSSDSRITDVFDDGQVLFAAVCEHGLEGVVAKKRSGIYRPGYRGWTKVKNPTYWRRGQEIESLRRSLDARGLAPGMRGHAAVRA